MPLWRAAASRGRESPEGSPPPSRRRRNHRQQRCSHCRTGRAASRMRERRPQVRREKDAQEQAGNQRQTPVPQRLSRYPRRGVRAWWAIPSRIRRRAGRARTVVAAARWRQPHPGYSTDMRLLDAHILGDGERRALPALYGSTRRRPPPGVDGLRSSAVLSRVNSVLGTFLHIESSPPPWHGPRTAGHWQRPLLPNRLAPVGIQSST